MGLPLAMAAAQNNFEVTGFDINVEKVAKISNGISTVEDISDAQLRTLLKSGNYRITDDPVFDSPSCGYRSFVQAKNTYVLVFDSFHFKLMLFKLPVHFFPVSFTHLKLGSSKQKVVPLFPKI